MTSYFKSLFFFKRKCFSLFCNVFYGTNTLSMLACRQFHYNWSLGWKYNNIKGEWNVLIIAAVLCLWVRCANTRVCVWVTVQKKIKISTVLLLLSTNSQFIHVNLTYMTVYPICLPSSSLTILCLHTLFLLLLLLLILRISVAIIHKFCFRAKFVKINRFYGFVLMVAQKMTSVDSPMQSEKRN